MRLPKAAVESAGVTAGSEFELTVDNGELRLKRSRKTSPQLLAEMIAEMKRLGPENEPETIDWGPDRGSEIIDDAYSRGEITLEDLLGPEAADEPEVKRTKRSGDARVRRR